MTEKDVNASGNQGNMLLKFELGDKAGLWLMVMSIALLFNGIIMGVTIARYVAVEDVLHATQTQARLTELKLDDWNALMLREGLRQPGDYSHGPGGNIGYEKSKVKSQQ